MFFWNSLAFLVIQQMLAIWSLVSLLFLNPAWTSGSLQLTYCWNMAWRILSITLLVCEMSATVQCFEHSLMLPFFGIGMKNWPVQPCGHCRVFHICWHIECSTFTAASFRTWNKLKFYLKFNWNSLTSTSFVRSDTSKAHLTLHSRMSGSRWVVTPLWLSWCEDLLCTVLLCILATSS